MHLREQTGKTDSRFPRAVFVTCGPGRRSAATDSLLDTQMGFSGLAQPPERGTPQVGCSTLCFTSFSDSDAHSNLRTTDSGIMVRTQQANLRGKELKRRAWMNGWMLLSKEEIRNLVSLSQRLASFVGWLIDLRDKESQKQTERELPTTGSLPRCAQQPGQNWGRHQNRELKSGLPHGSRNPVTQLPWPTPRASTSRKLQSEAKARTTNR